MRLLFFVVVVATTAFGFTPDGGPFTDDFEGPTLLETDVPPGRWTSVTRTSPSNTMLLSPDARHSGMSGVRMTESGLPADASWSVVLNSAPDVPVGERLFGRVWLHLVDPLAPDSTWLTMFAGSPSIYVSAATDADGGVLGLVSIGAIAADGFASERGIAGALTHGPNSRWQLIEFETTGLGTAAGTRTLWLDGELQTERAGIDFTNAGDVRGNVELGMPHSDRRTFVGRVDFDDVWAARWPLPNRAALVDAGTVVEGTCVALTVQLLDARGTVAPAPLPLVIDVRGAAPCGNDRIEAGADEGVIDVIAPDAGVWPVRVSNGALLQRDAVIVLVQPAPRPDAGIPEPVDAGDEIDAGASQPLEARQLEVQCGCSAGEASMLVLAIVLARRWGTRI